MSADLTYHVIHLENGRLASDTPPERVAEIARRAAAHSGHGGIVLHFHGGLVPRSDGMQIAERLLPIYHDPLRGDGYPIFFVWESGLLEILRNNLPEIASEKLFGILWKRLARIVVRKAAQRPHDRVAFVLPDADTAELEAELDRAAASGEWGRLAATGVPAIETPLSEVEALALESELHSDLELELEVQAVSHGLLGAGERRVQVLDRTATVRTSSRTLMSPTALDRLVDRPDPAARGVVTTARVVKAIVTIAARVIERMLSGRDHGFHATLVEEVLRELYIANVGGLVWTLMKNDTADAFAPRSEAGGTALLTALSTALAGRAEPRITLVGHSTGAVYIAELLDAAASLGGPAASFDVVFLAPAASFARVSAMLSRHAPRIARFRTFAMRDEVERADRMLGVLYPHSLLYFVSGILETEVDMPLVGMQRFFDEQAFGSERFPEIAPVRRFVLDAARAVWATTGPAAPGWASDAARHGDFDNDPYTLDSLAALVSGRW